MERITPNEFPSKPVDSEDPFGGDSFTNFSQYNILPPPEPAKTRHSKPLKPPVDRSISDSSPPITGTTSGRVQTSPKPQNTSPPIATGNTSPNVSWMNDSLFDEDSNPAPEEDSRLTPQRRNFSTEIDSALNISNESSSSKFVDAFSDLDPLGTGKIKPYVDKKFFFHELKNPPKKVLKELSNSDVNFPAFSPTMRDGRKDSDEGSLPERKESDDKLEDPFFNLMVDPFAEDVKVEDQNPQSLNKGDNFFEFSFPDEHKQRKASIDSMEQKSERLYTGALKVNLPPESLASSYVNQRRVERQSSDASNYSSLGGSSASSTVRNRPSSMFKQNTVGSMSSKKMMKPHLFGQKFSKRDSNSINMRRLQESDSLSENEAPEPPPRPDAGFYAEPPPLPPKKQFSDIIIRQTTRSGLAKDTPRYESTGTIKSRHGGSINQDAPPLPLPSRKVGRTDSSFPGPERPFKSETSEEDYLAPNPQKSDLPILLPPPQTDRNTKRGSRKPQLSSSKPESISNLRYKNEDVEEHAISDITLTSLLTLNIDDLAQKLDVPAHKLSTMTIVELTKYLSEFLVRENNTRKPQPIEEEVKPEPVKARSEMTQSVFKVSFDQSSDATFVAVFDDNFGEEEGPNEQPFVANFDNMESGNFENSRNNVDKYAVFREIIECELNSADVVCHSDETEEEVVVPNSGDLHVKDDEPQRVSPIALIPDGLKTFEIKPSTIPTLPKTRIDTKITEAISQAKDRYAALRDIILVEDLFEKPIISSQINVNDEEEDIGQEESDFDKSYENVNRDNSPSIVIGTPVELVADDNLDESEKPNEPAFLSTKDDVEIDELMNLAVSNLSLNNHSLSPMLDSQQKNASTSPITKSQSGSPSPLVEQVRQNVTDTSTSPIPIHKNLSPVPMATLMSSNQVTVSTSPRPPSATDRPQILNTLDDPIKRDPHYSGSLSDMVCASSSPDLDNNQEGKKLK